MSKKNAFLNYFDEITIGKEIPTEVKEFVDALRIEKEKPLFTDNGKVVLGFLKTVPAETLSAKAIAENLGLSTKTVSGAMRKLVTDGFIEKVGTDPCLYTITEKGINIIIE